MFLSIHLMVKFHAVTMFYDSVAFEDGRRISVISGSDL